MTQRARLVGVFVACCAAVAITVLARAHTDHLPAAKPAFAVPYDQRPINDVLEALLVQGDGQAFATLARDPSLARANEEFTPSGEGAYRAQRPLLPYLAWMGSLGRPGWVPPALASLYVLAIGAAAAAVATLLRSVGRSEWWTLLVLVLPGTYASLEYFGPEALGLALALWGVVLWRRRDGGSVGAIALFAAAGLARETMLLLPLGLAAAAVLDKRPRDAVRLASSAVPFALWLVVLRVRLGAFPFGGSLNGRIGARGEGVVDVLLGHSADPTDDRYFLAMTVALLLSCLVLRRQSELTPVAFVFVAFALFMGPRVWAEWTAFGRVLLPMHVLAIVALAEPRRAEVPASTPVRHVEEVIDLRDAAVRAPRPQPRPATTGAPRAVPAMQSLRSGRHPAPSRAASS